jgi:excisionase family DNA binding protein
MALADIPELLRKERAAGLLDCSVSSLDRLVRTGRLRAIKTAIGIRIPRTEIERIIGAPSSLPPDTEPGVTP